MARSQSLPQNNSLRMGQKGNGAKPMAPSTKHRPWHFQKRPCTTDTAVLPPFAAPRPGHHNSNHWWQGWRCHCPPASTMLGRDGTPYRQPLILQPEVETTNHKSETEHVSSSKCPAGADHYLLLIACQCTAPLRA